MQDSLAVIATLQAFQPSSVRTQPSRPKSAGLPGFRRGIATMQASLLQRPASVPGTCKKQAELPRSLRTLAFLPQGLRESGFTAEEFLMAGFQIKDCEVVGSADKCFEAMNEMRQRDGRSAQFWIDRGYTAEECRKGGYTKEQIEKASFD